MLPRILCLVVVAVALVAPAGLPLSAADDKVHEAIHESVPTHSEVQDLQKERLAVVSQFVAAIEQNYRIGKATVTEVNHANTQLLKAKLDLCESDIDRLAVYEQSMKSASDYEKVIEQLFQAGKVSHAAVLAAKVSRLDAEIRLERARAELSARAKDDNALELKVPESLRLRHKAFHAEFSQATKEKGKVGEAARAIEKLANAHFAKAKDAFSALALLSQLSEGKVSPEMRKVVPMAERLKASLPQIRREHRELIAGLKRLAEAAGEEGKTAFVHFAERLIWHIQEEEEVLYPAVLLVGEYVKEKLGKEP